MLAERRVAEEMMDDPNLEPAIYRDVVHDLAKVNRVTLAHRPTLDFLRKAVGHASSFRLLDVGFGDGDMLRAIARWARSKGIDADLEVRLEVHRDNISGRGIERGTEVALAWTPERATIVLDDAA